MRWYGWGLNPIGSMPCKKRKRRIFLSVHKEVVWAQMRWWSHTSQEKKAQNEACPAGSLILDFEPSERWEVHFCRSHHSVFDVSYCMGIKLFILFTQLSWQLFWGVIVSRPSFIHQNDLEGFVKHRLLGLTPGISNLVGLGWPEKSHV